MTEKEARELLHYYGYCQKHGEKMELLHVSQLDGKQYWKACPKCEKEGEDWREKKIAEAKAVLGLK